MSFKRTVLVSVLVCSTSSPALAKNITESFTDPVTVSDGATLGKCNQLTAVLSSGGGGTISIPGNGFATISTPAETDAAFLYSTDPLPASGYKTAVQLTNLGYVKQQANENGVTLLSLFNTKPKAATDLWWWSYRMIGVEINIQPTSTTSYPLYISYWDSTDIHTWNGTVWQAGDTNWAPVLDLDPKKTYAVEIEKANASYTITVRQGSQVLTQATVQAQNVLPATTEYMAVGDRFTTFFTGSVDVGSVSMPEPPGCTPPLPDGGPPTDSSAPSTDGQPASDAVIGERPSWDLYTPDLGKTSSRGEDGCSCEIDAPPSEPPLPALLLLVSVLLCASRRRD